MFAAVLMSVCAVCAICGISASAYGFYDGCPVVNYFVYTFFHANVFHCVANCIALFGLRNSNRFLSSFILSFLAAALCGFFSPASQPTVGASAMIYAWVGMLMHKRIFSQGFIIMVLSTGLMAVLPNVNFIVHVLALASGVCIGFVTDKIISVYHDRKSAAERG
jgi:membrane associated rhomboid family serine protease